MADIYQITTPNGSTYNLKDKWARDEIANIESAISGGVIFMGETTTPLTDGCTTSTVVINGNNVTALKGYLVVIAKYTPVVSSTKYATDSSHTSSSKINYYTGVKKISGASYPYNIELTGELTNVTITDAPEQFYQYYEDYGNYYPCLIKRTNTVLDYYAITDVTENSTGVGKEFLYDGIKWIELGDLSLLGDLAWVDTASGTYTPAGSVSQPTFTGNSLTSTGNFTPSGSVTVGLNTSASTSTGAISYISALGTKSFSGTAATIKPKVTAAGSVAITTGSGTANYTPSGSVSAPIITKNQAGSTTTVNSITDVGTLPTLTTSVANENLTISFSQGTLPTKGANTTVKTGDATYSADAPTFTGTGAELVATFTGTEVEGTASYTPAGSVTVNSTTSYLTGTGSFSGTQGSVSVTGTPAGTVSKPTFSGTQATITVAPAT